MMGAAGTAVIDIMVTKMGRGWCFTFIALVCIVMLPLMWIETKMGPKWREERRVRMLPQDGPQNSASSGPETSKTGTLTL